MINADEADQYPQRIGTGRGRRAEATGVDRGAEPGGHLRKDNPDRNPDQQFDHFPLRRIGATNTWSANPIPRADLLLGRFINFVPLAH